MTSNPIPRRTFLSVALASAAAGALASCGFSGNDEPTTPAGTGGSAGGAPSSTGAGSSPAGSTSSSGAPGSSAPGAAGGTLRQAMLPVPHLDPALTGSISAQGNLLQTGLMEGLVVRDPDDGNKVLPGVAETWDVSDDGLVYTFHLRSNAVWSNGDPVTADDFVWNWQRLLSPATVKDSQYKSSANPQVKGVKGAAAFFGGKTDDFSTVGVTAKDKGTLEITLEAPDPLFLPTLAEWRTLPLNPKSVQAHPKDWFEPANWVGNGAFVLSEWRANAGCTLQRSEKYWDTASYSIDTWKVNFNDGGDTAQMVSYQADEIDTFMVQGDPAAIVTDPGLAKQLQSGTPSQFKCLVLMASKNPVLENIKVRQALSLAIDRQAIAQVASPDQPGGSLVPSGIVGYDQVPATAFDPDKAKQLLADAGYPGGKGIPTINLLVYAPTPFLEAIGGMWQEHLGVNSSIDLVEVGVYGTKRAAVAPEDYVGFSFGYFGLTPPTMYKAVTWGIQGLGPFALPSAAAAEFQQVSADKDMAPADQVAKLNDIQQKNWFPEFKKYVDLVGQATAAAADPDKVQELSIKAAVAREESYIALPVLWAGYNFMVKPDVHDLTITSFPDQVFTLKGVTVG
jgi:ABC-type oligopeptide transport system substrate-binding subunit